MTPVKTAYWNHTPLLLVTPQAANKTIGQGGFQEVAQMALFEEMVCYQEEVRDASRMAEVLNRVIENAHRQSAPAQINVPRDLWTQEVDIELPPILSLERSAGGESSVAEAARLLSEARFPVILSGGGVVIGDAIDACRALAERLDAPVCSGYQHNDSFPGSHSLAVGPLGYNGSKAAMELISQADVVLALGTRLNPFSTLPGYGIDYWPKDAAVIQVDMNPDRIGLTKKVTVGICGDAKKVAQQLRERLSGSAGDAGRGERRAAIHQTRSAWLQTLSSMDHEDDDPGTTWNEDARTREPDRMSARMAWRAIQDGLPKDAIISSDIGNNCAIGNAYPTFEEGRKYLAPGLFGPCGYGFPAIIGAKIGCPHVPVVGFAGDGAFGISMSEMASMGREGLAGDHHGDLPQLPVGRGEAELDTLVRQQLRRHRAQSRPELRQGRRRLRAEGRGGAYHGGAEGSTPGVVRGAGRGRHHLHRGHPEPGARRALPPRRDEEAERRGGHQRRGHANPVVDIVDRLIERARQRRRAVVLPEGDDPRIVEAARRLHDDGIARPILIGEPATLERAAACANVSLEPIDIVSPSTSGALDGYASLYIEGRPKASERVAKRLLAKPLFYAAMAVKAGDADALVAGATQPTARVIEAGLMSVGLAGGHRDAVELLHHGTQG